MKRKYDWIDVLTAAPVVLSILAQIILLIYIIFVKESQIYLEIFEFIAGGGTIFYEKKLLIKLLIEE